MLSDKLTVVLVRFYRNIGPVLSNVLQPDSGIPAIRVGHGTSEKPGMMELARYVNASLKGVTAEYKSQDCAYRLVCGSGS